MRIRTPTGFLCFALLSLAVPGPAVAEGFPGAIHAYLQQRVQAHEHHGGLVVGLVDEHGRRIVGCGKARDGSDQEVNGDTLFEIGSVTKTFTTLLLQDMVQGGRVKLDDPVARHLPRSVVVPTRGGKDITLRQLATHTSGLPGMPDNLDPQRADNPYADYTVEKLYAFLSRHHLARDPGAKSEYSNLGLGLLGHALALTAGTNYEALVVDRICRPLGMDSTRVTLTPDLKARFVTPHNEFGEPVPSWDLPTLGGAGALRSTAHDLLNYVSAGLGLTPSELTPIMKQTHELGLCWVVSPGRQGTRIVWYSGGTLGCSAFVGLDEARRRGVVVLANSRGVGIGELGCYLLGSEWQSDRRGTAAPLDSQDLSSYVGHYRCSAGGAPGALPKWPFPAAVPRSAVFLPAGGCLLALLVGFRRAGRSRKRWFLAGGAVLVCGLLAGYLALGSGHVAGAWSPPDIGIRREGDRLLAQATRREPSPDARPPADDLLPPGAGELLPESATRFFERLSGMPVTFFRDPQGRVTGFVAHSHGNALAYERTSDQPPTAPEPLRPRVAVKLNTRLLDACVGRYEFPPDGFSPGGIKVKIWREGDLLLWQAWGERVLPGAIDVLTESETTFFLKINNARLTFVKDDTGEVTAVVHRLEGWPDIEGKKQKE